MSLIMVSKPCAVCGRATAVGPTELKQLSDHPTMAAVCDRCTTEIREAKACPNPIQRLNRLKRIQDRALARAVAQSPNTLPQ